jgi:prepilin-type N-terminal cleavage/methylation domain-containing protein
MNTFDNNHYYWHNFCRITCQEANAIMKKSGFTLIELMVVIAIMSIAAGIAIPNIIGWIPNYRLGKAAGDMASAFQKARLSAIKGHTDMVVSINLGNNSYMIFQDDGAGGAIGANGISVNAQNWIRDGSEHIQLTEPLPAGISINNASFSGATSFRYDSRGLSLEAAGNSTLGTLTLANNRGWSQRLVLSSTGSVTTLRRTQP